MWKWLRSWFAWRFSLGRLVIATVFLGAVVGLNVREIGPVFRPVREVQGNVVSSGSVCAYYGWPFPFMNAYSDEALYRNTIDPRTEREGYDSANAAWWATRWDAACTYQYPLTHQTYRFPGVVCGRLSPVASVLLALTDLLFALTVLALILFLQIPRRKAPEQVE